MNSRELIILGAGAAALVLWMMEQQASSEVDDPDYEAPDVFDQASALWDDITNGEYMTVWEQQNVTAFLLMLRKSEGTSGPNGYSTLVGGGQFYSFDDHPRMLVYLPNLKINSSAAGAYQILQRTWDSVAAKLSLTDFTPISQDRAAIELIRGRGALGDVRAGRFADAVAKCKKEWASLPGAGYGQHENALATLQTAYVNAGGNLA